MINRLRVAALIAVLLFLGSPAFADERITRFLSDIAITADGSANFREEITVTVDGAMIKHGIFRDFPSLAYGSPTQPMPAVFEVARVTMDGKAARYTVENMNGAQRVRIGDENVTVEPGAHTYSISYSTGRLVLTPDTAVAFRWTVTGYGWALPIDSVEATIHVPPGSSITQYGFHSGNPAAPSGTVDVKQSADGTISFHAQQELQPGEGLSVSVNFQSAKPI